MKIDFSYIINMTQDFDMLCKRFVDSQYHMGENSEIPFFVLYAPNGRKLVEGTETVSFAWAVYQNWKTDSPQSYRWENWVYPGEVGCALSHFWVWSNALAQEKGVTLFLEEDFQVSTWPSQEEWDALPEDWDLVFLHRNYYSGNPDTIINEHVVKPGYSYGAHAYILSTSGQQKLLGSGLLNNIIPVDEFLMGVIGVHPRQDIKDLFYQPDFNAYSFGRKNFIQGTSTRMSSEIQLPSPLRDVRDWNDWVSRYINPLFAQKDYKNVLGLINTQGGVLQIPLFTEDFCDDAIELIERSISRLKYKDGEFIVTGRDLDFNNIYNKCLFEYLIPFLNWYWQSGLRFEIFTENTYLVKHWDANSFDFPRFLDFGYCVGLRLTEDESLSNTEKMFPEKRGNILIHPTLIRDTDDGREIVYDSKYSLIKFF